MSHLATTDYSASRIATHTVNETAALLRVARSTVYRLEHQGVLRSVRVGKRKRFRAEEIDRFLREGAP